MLGALAGLGRKTVTGMLCATGQQFVDWSAAYRVFGKSDFSPDALFAVARRESMRHLSQDAPLSVSIDDTLLRRTGRMVHGAGFRRDPMGPAFHTNLVWGQRFLQMCAAVPASQQPGPATCVPLDFLHAPTAKKPRKNASEEDVAQYQQEQKRRNLSAVAVARIKHLRDCLDADGQQQRAMWMSGDGGYTNSTVLRNLPPNTIFIGRIRKDAKLYHPPCAEQDNPRGRKRSYGCQAPTPEELRTDDKQPWQQVSAWAVGALREFRVKTLAPVQWRTAGAHQHLRLIVIAPLGYRLTKGGKLLYRQPAYLLCTDPELSLEQVVQNYMWRWGIEVNHRDEKQLIGVGQAHVRTEAAAKNLPAMLVASYSFLRLAALSACGQENGIAALPPPRWNQKTKPPEACTPRLIQQLRAELWGRALDIHNFSGFASRPSQNTKSQKCYPEVASAVLYATS